MPVTSTRATRSPTKSSRPTKKSGKPEPTVQPATVDRFPFTQYTSILGVRLILVGFVALYLPQTSHLFTPPVVAKKTDRPQSEFMAALTANPPLTLGWISVGLTLLEVWWASWMQRWSFEQRAKGTEVEVKLERMQFDSLRFTRLKNATAFTLCVTLGLHVVIVVFGAPLTTHILETALLAFVVAILTTFTPAFVLGVPSLASDTPSMVARLTWIRLFAELSPRNTLEYTMAYSVVGTFVGGWLGAIPIALDWDRPWQAWSLTPLFGSIGGYMVGAVLAFAFSIAKWPAIDMSNTVLLRRTPRSTSSQRDGTLTGSQSNNRHHSMIID